MSNSVMIERVQAAIEEAFHDVDNFDSTSMARAAIAAMREPDPAALEPGLHIGFVRDADDVARLFNAVIGGIINCGQ